MMHMPFNKTCDSFFVCDDKKLQTKKISHKSLEIVKIQEN